MFTLIIAAAVLGCDAGGGGPATAPATGVVTLDGQGVAGATVFFEPADPASGLKTSVGDTDDAGRFTMQTHVEGNTYKTGVVPGQYLVAVEKLEVNRELPSAPPKDLLPPQYKDAKSSGLTAEVKPDQPNEFEFQLEP